MRPIFIVSVVLVFFLGCTKDYSNLPQIEVDFNWPEQNATVVSPEIKLKNVPEGTKELEINMFDLDNSHNHGGGTVVYNGSNVIPERSLKKYQGPAPVFMTPLYEISVKAIDSDGEVIGFGKKSRKYPPE